MTAEWRAVFFLALLLCVGATASHAAPVTEDPVERQMLDIAKDLRCAVCQNQPVSESNSDLARDMRAIIREQLQAGKSRAEIIDYFVARYGDYVLLKPPYRGTGFPLWIVPLVLVLVLVLSAFGYLQRRRRAALPPAPPLSDADRARVNAARRDD